MVLACRLPRDGMSRDRRQYATAFTKEMNVRKEKRKTDVPICCQKNQGAKCQNSIFSFWSDFVMDVISIISVDFPRKFLHIQNKWRASPITRRRFRAIKSKGHQTICQLLQRLGQTDGNFTTMIKQAVTLLSPELSFKRSEQWSNT